MVACNGVSETAIHRCTVMMTTCYTSIILESGVHTSMTMVHTGNLKKNKMRII